MATNPTNSTSVNIRNLPTAQLAVDTDYVILQTNNGTQIISFKDFNVVKTDILGNATVIGTLSGNNASFTGGVNMASLSASGIWVTSNGRSGPGATYAKGYYDNFTVVNGIITSAVATSVDYASNPLYTTLHSEVTAVSARANKNIFDAVVTNGITIGAYANPTYVDGTITGIPAGVTSLAATDFTITPGNGVNGAITAMLSCVPYIQQVSTITGGTATVRLNGGGIMPISITYGVRVLKTY